VAGTIITAMIHDAYEVTISVLFTRASFAPERKSGDRALCELHDVILTGTTSWHSSELLPIGLPF